MMNDLSSMYDSVTVILLVVSVPVLSEQIVVADPMTSHENKLFTKLWSFIIF